MLEAEVYNNKNGNNLEREKKGGCLRDLRFGQKPERKGKKSGGGEIRRRKFVRGGRERVRERVVADWLPTQIPKLN